MGLGVSNILNLFKSHVLIKMTLMKFKENARLPVGWSRMNEQSRKSNIRTTETNSVEFIIPSTIYGVKTMSICQW